MGREFKTYIATTRVSLGVYGNRNEEQLVVDKGTEVQFNGQTLIFEGQKINLPRLSSAIDARWFIDVEDLFDDGEPEYRAPSARIHMSAATPQQEAVVASRDISTEEDLHLGTVSEVRALGRYENPSSYQIEEQGGVEVQGVSFRSKASKNNEAPRIDVSRVSTTAIQNLERGEGVAQAKAQQFEALERQRMEREIADLKSQYKPAQAKPRTPKQDPEKLAMAAELERLRAQLAQTQQAPQVPMVQEADDLEDFEWEDEIEVASASTEDLVDPEDVVSDKDSRLALARQMMPDFDWDFSVNWRRKLAILEEKESPLFVCSVYAVESDAMKKQIASKFPQYNLGN
jgi:hypothetical protein